MVLLMSRILQNVHTKITKVVSKAECDYDVSDWFKLIFMIMYCLIKAWSANLPI